MQWDFKAGKPALTPKIESKGQKPWLIVALHSQCPCSIATIENLIALPPEERRSIRMTLLFTGPDPHHSQLTAKAEALPEAEKQFITEEEIVARYGARTSGQALIYNAEGALVFSGGLTDSRGSAGDSTGMQALADVISGRPCIPNLPVYGCALQTPK